MVERFALPPVVADAVAARSSTSCKVAGAVTTVFGDGVLQCLDTTLAGEGGRERGKLHVLSAQVCVLQPIIVM